MKYTLSETALAIDPRGRYPQFKHKILFIALLLLAVIAIIGLAALTYPLHLTVDGDIVARSVTLGLVDGLDDEPDLPFAATATPPDRPVMLSYADTLEPPFGDPKATKPATVAIIARSVRLSALDISKGALLTISTPHAQELDLSTAGAEAFYDLEVYDAKSVIVDGAPATGTLKGSDKAAVHVKASRDRANPAPMHLRGKTNDRLTLDDVRLSLIRFGEYRANSRNGRPIISSIVSGTLKLPQVSGVVDIGAGTAITLGDFDGTMIRLEAGPDSVHIWFTGTVTALTVNLLARAEDRFPSVLNWLAHNNTASLVLAAIAAVVGALGSFSNLSQWIFDRKKPH